MDTQLQTTSVMELIAEHGGSVWGTHPDFPREDWQGEAGDEDTILGYWEHVAHALDLEDRTAEVRQFIDQRFSSVWDEHPEISRQAWVCEVRDGDTVLGYWEFVISQIEQSADEQAPEPSSGDARVAEQLKQWAEDFEEAARLMPTRLRGVVLMTRAQECREQAGKLRETPAVGDDVSVDVSTGEEDADRRVFATIEGRQESLGSPGGKIWLAGMDQDNFNLIGNEQSAQRHSEDADLLNGLTEALHELCLNGCGYEPPSWGEIYDVVSGHFTGAAQQSATDAGGSE